MTYFANGLSIGQVCVLSYEHAMSRSPSQTTTMMGTIPLTTTALPMDGKKLHASGNSADDLTEMAKPQPEVCDITQHLFASRSKVLVT